MERFHFKDLKPGESLRVETEAGSIYTLIGEVPPERVGGNMFRGFRVTRESNHDLNGYPFGPDASHISDEPACVELHSPDEGVMIVGHRMEVLPDILHEEADGQRKFANFVTSGITNIELISPESLEN
ncbi:MAG TPA: hypothetical protein VFJ84_02970 [Candidatus Saccharimonadales bacterium]|nr:hypothetical protein [Candidatus Saccharimonadales bacterium]